MQWVEGEHHSDEIVLECSGRREYANAHTIGIGPGGYVCYGSDGGIHTDDFTDAEREELADAMIALWQQFKTKES